MNNIFSLLLGIAIGVISFYFASSLDSNTTEVWQTNVELTAPSGIVIPAGTELVVTERMPEGFVALSLAINIEGDELEAFKKAEVSKPNLRIPVWVEKSR